MHEINIQIFGTEIYKVSKRISPPQITELFARRNEDPYNLRNNAAFELKGPQIWGMVLDTYKNIDRLYDFKKVIKKWKPENCPCRICKVFVKNIGFSEVA